MKVLPCAVVLAAANVCTATAQTTEQYDLVCSGNVSVKTIGEQDSTGAPVPEGPFPYSMKLHVNLAKKTYCQDDCASPQAIYAIKSDDIIFNFTKEAPEQRFWMARDEGLFFKVWIEAGDARKKQPVVQKSAQGQCTFANPIATEANTAPTTPTKAKPATSSVPNVTREEDPPSHANALTVQEITALVDVANHRPISSALLAHLHALGYLVWVDDTLQLTDKGRSVVGGG